MSISTIWTDPTVDGTVEMPVSAELMGRTAPVWPATVISQYANSPRILALIEAFAAAVDPTRLVDAFYTSIWDIDTASGYGLDVWGRIVNVSRGLYIPGGTTGELFGFEEEGIYNVYGFGLAPFNSHNHLTPNYELSDAIYRNLILVKAFSNISARNIQAINAALLMMFPGEGNVYMSDLGGMQANVVFGFYPTPLQLAILLQSGAFPWPSGVQVGYQTRNLGTTLGFEEQGAFVGTFANGSFNS